MAANATFALKPGVWFLRVRFVIFAPDSRREPSPPSGRKSTQPTVQILEASSLAQTVALRRWLDVELLHHRIEQRFRDLTVATIEVLAWGRRRLGHYDAPHVRGFKLAPQGEVFA